MLKILFNQKTLWIIFSLMYFSTTASASNRPPWRRHGRKVKVKINSVPTGANVYIEDKKWGIAGITPTRWIRLPRNRAYKIILTHPDMEDFVTTIQLTRRYRNRFTFTMKRKIRPGFLELKDNGTSLSIGAKIKIDGQDRGTIPSKIKLMPGKYALTIEKQGFKPFSSMITITENSTQVLMISLIKLEKPKGKVLISSDVDSAVVEVDKTVRGTTPLLVSLEPGSHLIVVKYKDNKYQQIVNVKPNSTSNVIAKLKPKEEIVPTGFLSVISNIDGSEVLIDGIVKGKTPLNRVKVIAGEHLIEVRKKGYLPNKKTVNIKPNIQNLQTMDIEKAPIIVPTGSLKITSEMGANIYVDGQLKGKSSYYIEKVKSGSYQVAAVKKGYKRIQKIVTVSPNKTTAVHLPLERVGSIKILANVVGATVIIDNQPVGKVPLLNYELKVGTYRLELHAKGFRPYAKTISIAGGNTEPITYNINLLPLGPTPMEIAAMKSSLSAYGGKVIPPRSFTASAGMDWPYYLDSKLMVGIWRKGQYGIDGGATFRSYFTLTEFIFNIRGEFFSGGPLTLGGFMDMGGGIGVDSRTNFTWNMGVAATLSFREKVNLSLGAYLNVYRDRFCLSKAPNPGDPASEPSYCKEYDTDPTVFDAKQVDGWKGHSPRDPYWGARIVLTTIVEWALNPMHSVYARFKWAAIPLKPGDTIYRPAYMDLYNGIMPKNDTTFYGGVGFLWKF